MQLNNNGVILCKEAIIIEAGVSQTLEANVPDNSIYYLDLNQLYLYTFNEMQYQFLFKTLPNIQQQKDKYAILYNLIQQMNNKEKLNNMMHLIQNIIMRESNFANLKEYLKLYEYLINIVTSNQQFIAEIQELLIQKISEEKQQITQSLLFVFILQFAQLQNSYQFLEDLLAYKHKIFKHFQPQLLHKLQLQLMIYSNKNITIEKKIQLKTNFLKELIRFPKHFVHEIKFVFRVVDANEQKLYVIWQKIMEQQINPQYLKFILNLFLGQQPTSNFEILLSNLIGKLQESLSQQQYYLSILKYFASKSRTLESVENINNCLKNMKTNQLVVKISNIISRKRYLLQIQ